MSARVRVNQQITAPELRVVDENGGNLGILPRVQALALAAERGLDLIEVAPKAVPPVAKVMDHGKFQYLVNKKVKRTKTKSHTSETKSIQVKIGTSQRDLDIKANKASAFIQKGHRVRVKLFLPGRAKQLDSKFLAGRLERLLRLITTPYKVSGPAERGTNNLSIIIEKAK